MPPINNLNDKFFLTIPLYNNEESMQTDEYKVLKKVISEDLTPDRKKSLRELKREILVNICQNKRADITLFLSNMDLSGVNLSNLDLSGADLTSTNLCGANFNGANISHTNMMNADLSGSSMINAKLNGIYWWNTNLDHVQIDLDNIPYLPLSKK